MSSHYFHNSVGMSYLDQTFSQRHWSTRLFHIGKHHHSYAVRMKMLLLRLAILFAPIIRLAILLIDAPLLLKRHWKMAAETVSAMAIVIVLLTYSLQ